MTALWTSVAGGGSGVDPDEARRAARDILSGSEYAQPEESLLDRVLGWIADRLDDLASSTVGGGPGDLVAWLFVIGLVAVAIWLVAKTLRAPRRRADADDDGLRYGTETHRDAAVWLAEAERLAAAGELRGALRCRHQALIATLVRHQVVADVAGRTAREHRDEAAGVVPSVRDRLDAVTARFDDTWYGGRPVDGATYREFAADCERIEAASSGARAPTGAPT